MSGTKAVLAGTRRASEPLGVSGRLGLHVRRDVRPGDFVGSLGVMAGRSFGIYAPCPAFKCLQR
jgi:hypothetical protein